MMKNETTLLTAEDIKTLTDYGIIIKTDIPIFLQELKKYLESVWQKKNIDELDISNLETFNKSINYPSWEAYEILSNAFTGNCPIEILSNKSQELLGFFYNIRLY